MDEERRGVVVQLVLPTLKTRQEIDEALTASYADVRLALYEVLDEMNAGKDVPAVIVRDFRVDGGTQHYV